MSPLRSSTAPSIAEIAATRFFADGLLQVVLGDESPPHLACIGLSVSNQVQLIAANEGFEPGPSDAGLAGKAVHQDDRRSRTNSRPERCCADDRAAEYGADKHGRARIERAVLMLHASVATDFEEMEDDPYRSLAGDLRHPGGYSKVDVPFLEFLWANHLRQKVPRRLLVDDPKEALAKALKIAASKRSSFLPGWCRRS